MFKPVCFNLFPAYAGVILGYASRNSFFSAFPRTCGGDPGYNRGSSYANRFSPHMRG